MEIIDKAVQSLVTLVGSWMPVASQAKRETVFYDEGIIMFFKERARDSLAQRDDIPDNIKIDLISFDTEHIDTIIHQYALRIGHLTPVERARASKGKADLTSIIKFFFCKSTSFFKFGVWRITSSWRMRSMWRIRRTL